MKKHLYLLGVLSLLIQVADGQQSTVNLAVSAEAYVTNKNPNSNYSDTLVDYFYAKTYEDQSVAYTFRTYFDFDLSGIPSNAIIHSATLFFTGSNHQYLEEEFSGLIGFPTETWAEDEVSWNDQPELAVGSTIEVNDVDSSTENVSIDLTNRIRNLIYFPGTYTNYGFCFRLTEETPSASYRFYSGNATSSSDRPRLEINYELPVDLDFKLTSTPISDASSGSLNIQIYEGNPPYAYNWENDTATISTDKSASIETPGTYYLTVTDNISRTFEFELSAGYDPDWVSGYPTKYVTFENVLEKRSGYGWGEFCYSNSTLESGEDAWFEYTVSNLKARMFGFGDASELTGGYENILAGVYLKDDRTITKINATTQVNIGTYDIGDVIRVKKVGTTVSYYHNGTLLISAGVPSLSGIDLKLLASLYQPNIRLDFLRASFGPNLLVKLYGEDVMKTDDNGEVFAFPVNGTSPYTYLWSNSDTESHISGLGINTYTVTVTDANGKTAIESLTLVADPDESNNWGSSKFYDVNGELMGVTKSISDYNGNPIQSHSYSRKSLTSFASENIKDSYNRPVLSTLTAPTFENKINYKSGFIKASDGSPYDNTHFDNPISTGALGEVLNPDEVLATGKGNLGWYYSENNSVDPYQDITAFPYSRINYSILDPTQLTMSSGPHEEFKMGSGHESKSYRVPATGELMYMYGYAGDWELGADYSLITSGGNSLGVINNDQLKYDYKVYKVVTYDPDGKESVAFYDHNNKLIATALSGTGESGQNLYEMNARAVIKGPSYGKPRFVDIHIPDGCQSYLDLQESKPGTTSLEFDIYNLLTGELIHNNTTAANPNLSPGLYRIVDAYYVGTDYDGRNSLPEIHIKYKLNYHHFSLNYFDKKGQVVATSSPNGFDYNHFPDFTTTTQVQQADFDMLGSPNYYQFSLMNSTHFEKNITPPGSGEQQFSNVILFLSLNDYTIDRNNGNGSSNLVPTLPEGGGFEPLPETYSSDTSSSNPTYFGTISLEGDGGINIDPSFFCSGVQFPRNSGYTGCSSAQRPIYTPMDPSGSNYCVTCITRDPTNPNTCTLPTKAFDEKYELEFKISTYDGSSYTELKRLTFNAIKIGTIWTFSRNAQALDLRYPHSGSALVNLALSNTTTKVKITLNSVRKFILVPNILDCNYDIVEESTVLDFDDIRLNTIIETHNMGARPEHQIDHLYTYNSVGELISSQSVDEGINDFVYTKDGILRFSQSAQQNVDGLFSYTNYDYLLRPIEMGIVDESNTQGVKFQNHMNGITLGSGDPVTDPAILEDIATLRNVSGTAVNGTYLLEQTFVEYDNPDLNLVSQTGLSSSYVQNYVMGRVSKTYNENSTTWYSYLEDGRLDWMVTDINNFDVKTIHYEYDKRTGAVSSIIYQKDVSTDYFEHKYDYDIVGNLNKAYTRNSSTSSYVIEAEYIYNLMGDLSRVKIAGDLQGIDYTYNVLGMLKAINSPNIAVVSHKYFMDPGRDGLNGFNYDVFGMSFDYFEGDYQRTGFRVTSGTATNEYFDGKIAGIRWNTSENMAATNQQWTYDFDYQKTGWLKSADFLSVGPFGDNNNDPIIVNNTSGQYAVSNLSYDENGNIQSLNRTADNSVDLNIDEFTYRYDPLRPNRLAHLNDAVSSGNYSTDLDDQGTWTSNDSENWNNVYDAEGRLIEDKSAQMRYHYNAFGLIDLIEKHNGTSYVAYLGLEYNDGGLRSRKIAYNTSGQAINYTWYVRDASGAEVAKYEQEVGQSVNEPTYPILADARLGEYNRENDSRIYEFMDHLGNVRVTFGKDAIGELEVYSYADYYPFGSPLPGRNQISSPQYEHGYQGQFTEHDDETGLDAFELRLWDSRLARWTSTDPFGQFHSPYLGMGNNPVSGVDPDGGFWSAAATKIIGRAAISTIGGGLIGLGIAGANGKDLGQGFGYGAAAGFAAYAGSFVNWSDVGKATGKFLWKHKFAIGSGFLDGLMQGNGKIDLSKSKDPLNDVLDFMKEVNSGKHLGTNLSDHFVPKNNKGEGPNTYNIINNESSYGGAWVNYDLMLADGWKISRKFSTSVETFKDQKVAFIRMSSMRRTNPVSSTGPTQVDLITIKVNLVHGNGKRIANQMSRRISGY